MIRIRLFKYLNKYAWLAIQIFGGRVFQVGEGGQPGRERPVCPEEVSKGRSRRWGHRGPNM